MSNTVQATRTYQPGYWEVDMHDEEVGSFSEVMIPVEPKVGMVIETPEGYLFRLTEIRKVYDCDLVDAYIEWVV